MAKKKVKRKRAPGGGRKKKFGTETAIITKRVPKALKKEINSIFDEVIKAKTSPYNE